MKKGEGKNAWDILVHILFLFSLWAAEKFSGDFLSFIYENYWSGSMFTFFIILILLNCFTYIKWENLFVDNFKLFFIKHNLVFNFLLLFSFFILLDYCIKIQFIWKDNSLQKLHFIHILGWTAVPFVIYNIHNKNRFKNNQINYLTQKIQILQKKLTNGK